MKKGTITCEKNENKEYVFRYFDRDGNEIHKGDVITLDGKTEQKVYLANSGELGIDEYGNYPLTMLDMHSARLVKK